MEYYSAIKRNESESVVVRWMTLEPVLQSETSQRKINIVWKWKLLSHVWLFETPWTIQLEKKMAPLSSALAWKIPCLEEPGWLQSMGSLRIRHDWATSLSLFTFLHWRRKWQLTPVFLPGESQGRRSLVGCSPWGRMESDTTEAT